MLWPPAAWLARLASKRAWYSGVNGGCWAGPQRLVGSKTFPRPWPTPSVIALGPRRHWPFRSGYFVWSNAEAPAMVASSTDAAIEMRSSIAVLPCDRYQPAHSHDSADMAPVLCARFQTTQRQAIIHRQLPFREVFRRFPYTQGQNMRHRSSIGAAVAAALVMTSFAAQAFDDAKYPDLSGQWVAVRLGVRGQPAFDPTKP